MPIDGELTSDDGRKGGAPKDAELGSHFLEGDFVVFKAENQLFRVPVYQFISGSEVFRTLFSLPAGNEQEVEGRSENNPLVLPPTIAAEDFGNFMKVLYPQGTCSWFTLPKAVWISTLKLSTMWYFIHFRDVAIQRLSEVNDLWVISPIERVTLAREYKVPQWLSKGLQELAERRVLVSLSDAKKIGFETAFKLAHKVFGSDTKPPSARLGGGLQMIGAFHDEVQELTKEASMYTQNLNHG